MEPIIYKPRIYKGAGIYNTGSEGGGGGDLPIIIPDGYTRLQFVEINDTRPYCEISNNDLKNQFHINTSIPFSDSVEVKVILNTDKVTNAKRFDFIKGTANFGSNGISVFQYLNYGGNGFCVLNMLNGLYNYGGYQKTIPLYGEEYATGYYEYKMFYDENLKGSVNSNVVQLGTAPKEYINEISLLGCDEWSTRCFKGTKIFSIKYSDKLNFIPCKRNGDNKVGFWENINGVFVFPRGFSEGSLNPGPDF